MNFWAFLTGKINGFIQSDKQREKEEKSQQFRITLALILALTFLMCFESQLSFQILMDLIKFYIR